jgi:ribosomal protein S18 acetylase RimI-like enzyme
VAERRLDDVVISVEAAASVDDDLLAAVGTLIPQLSRSSPPPTPEMLEWIVEDDPRMTLFVARDEGRIVGMLTLAVFAIPTGVRAWIEDVVVDEDARGSGAGEALVQAALDRAADVGARTVDLTSRPDREAANRLYLRMGFEIRATNVYRRTLGPES